MATLNMILKNGGIATKLVVSHQLLILGNKTGYQNKAYKDTGLLSLDQINRLSNLHIYEY